MSEQAKLLFQFTREGDAAIIYIEYNYVSYLDQGPYEIEMALIDMKNLKVSRYKIIITIVYERHIVVNDFEDETLSE